MLKTELERLLDEGFEALGIGLSRRVYGEEFFAAASVDDAVGKKTVEQAVEKSKALKGKSEGEVVFGMIDVIKDLSDSQKEVMFRDGMPFFVKSWKYNGFLIKYEVSSEEEMLCYEQEADRIVKEGKVESEFVFLEFGPHKYFLTFGINTCLKNPGTVFVEADADETTFVAKVSDEALDILEQIDGKKYEPQKVYDAVMKVIES